MIQVTSDMSNVSIMSSAEQYFRAGVLKVNTSTYADPGMLNEFVIDDRIIQTELVDKDSQKLLDAIIYPDTLNFIL